jgi:HSP20 family protein
MAKAPAKKGPKTVEAVPVRAVGPLATWEREVDRLFDDLRRFSWPSLWHPERLFPGVGLRLQMPAVDVYEEKDQVIVKAELPGMGKDDIQVNLTGTTLTLKGEKKKEEEIKEHDYYRCERSYGSFTRTVELPIEVKGEEVKASFKDGVLEIRLPKSEEARRKQIKVQVQ